MIEVLGVRGDKVTACRVRGPDFDPRIRRFFFSSIDFSFNVSSFLLQKSLFHKNTTLDFFSFRSVNMHSIRDVHLWPLNFFWIEICVAVIYGKMFCLQIHFSNCNSDFDIEPLLVNSELTIRSVIIYRDKRCFRQLACLYLICNCHS